MADRPYQFVPFLMKYLHGLRYDLGTDVMLADPQTYNVALMQCTLHAMTLKILQDLHPDLVTDAALLDRLLTVIDTGPNGDRSGWPGWLLLPVPPEMLAQYGADESTDPGTLRQLIQDYNNPPPPAPPEEP